MKKACALLWVLLATVARGEAATTVDITACGQAIPAGAMGVLQIDLAGCANDVPAVTLGDKAKLYFEGHTIASGNPGVLCGRRCTLRGPGEISGSAGSGVELGPVADSRLLVRDLDIHDNADKGIRVPGSGEATKPPRVRLLDVTVQSNGDDGVWLWQGILSGADVNVSTNGFDGISALQKFKLKRLTVQSNTRDGLVAHLGGGKLVDSLLSLNGSVAGDVDIRTLLAPTLVNTGCGYSASYGSGTPFGVCSGD